MARPPRVFDPGSLLHVLSRASERQAIFSEEGERDLFVERLGRGASGWDGKVYAYVIMPNHFHLLLRMGAEPLHGLMQPLLTWYAKRYNWLRAREGHVFQGRYRAIVLEREGHLLEVVRYIHLNPVRAGLVECPEKWLGSSHGAYCAGGGSGWLAAGEALGLFSEDRSEAIERYRKFVEEGMTLGRRPEWYRSRPSGGRGSAARGTRNAQGVLALAERLGWPARRIGTEWDITSAETRALVVHAGIEAGGLSVAEVAATLGCHRATVERDFRIAEGLGERCRVFRERLGRLLRAESGVS